MQSAHREIGEPYDFVIIGSGFGGSVSALRLTEKGYRVLVLERGKRYRDEDFARSTWRIRKYLWAPALRCFGILQVSPLRDVFVLHGSGVGGGSLGYANVLMQPVPEAFDAPSWQKPFPWKERLAPHYDTARRMLGVVRNPCLWPADRVMRSISESLGQDHTFQATPVGTFFGEPGMEGEEVPDPYFGGEGPARRGCIHCGGCMVGCRHNAKNTLVKNYLYLAERYGAEVRPEAYVRDVRPLPPGEADGARYEVAYRRSTALVRRHERRVRARHVVFSAGVMGTLRLLFRCRDVTGSLPRISQRLGDIVRTNSEALTGVVDRTDEKDYSEGIAITSIFHVDPVTTVEPVRYPAGSSLMRLLTGPLVKADSLLARLRISIREIFRRPADFARTHFLPGWARRTTILLFMQTVDNRISVRLGRSPFTFFRKNLISIPDPERTVPPRLDIAHEVTHAFAERTGGVAAGSVSEGLLGIPMTAHVLGGCPYGDNAEEGVLDASNQIHNYPGLYVVDGSMVPANPGVNPSLTITAMSEYVTSRIPPKPGARVRVPIDAEREPAAEPG